MLRRSHCLACNIHHSHHVPTHKVLLAPVVAGFDLAQARAPTSMIWGCPLIGRPPEVPLVLHLCRQHHMCCSSRHVYWLLCVHLVLQGLLGYQVSCAPQCVNTLLPAFTVDMSHGHSCFGFCRPRRALSSACLRPAPFSAMPCCDIVRT